jgi:hypothetical protein
MTNLVNLVKTGQMPAIETISEKSDSDIVDEESLRDEAYVPPPLVTRSTILITGFILFVVAMIWPPLLLLATYLASLIIPYSYRLNDDATMRRHLLHKFEKEDTVSAYLWELPEDVLLQEKYWTNSRYVSMR